MILNGKKQRKIQQNQLNNMNGWAFWWSISYSTMSKFSIRLEIMHASDFPSMESQSVGSHYVTTDTHFVSSYYHFIFRQPHSLPPSLTQSQSQKYRYFSQNLPKAVNWPIFFQILVHHDWEGITGTDKIPTDWGLHGRFSIRSQPNRSLGWNIP